MLLSSERGHTEDGQQRRDNMKLGHRVCTLLVCCSALWVVVCSSRVKAPPPPPPPPPPGCNATLAFSSDVSSSSEGNGNIHQRSLSAWTWRSTTEKNRIPSTLWEAVCSSSFCSSPELGHSDRHSLNSVPVYQNVLVLTRRDGQRCYTASYRSLAVGCTCVWAKTSN